MDPRGEAWRAVDGWPYEVSDQGQVRRVKRNGATRLLKPSLQQQGYPVVMLQQVGADRTVCTVHQLVAAAFLGPRPEGAEIDHRDGVKVNNAAVNLEYVTCAENMRRAVALGLVCPPVRRSKLTRADVRSIRRRARAREAHAMIAADHGISESYVSRIAAGYWPATASRAVVL